VFWGEVALQGEAAAGWGVGDDARVAATGGDVAARALIAGMFFFAQRAECLHGDPYSGI
jgi:hypothetical protein